MEFRDWQMFKIVNGLMSSVEVWLLGCDYCCLFGLQWYINWARFVPNWLLQK